MRIKTIIAFILLLAASRAKGQTAAVDSLSGLLAKSKADTTTIDLKIKLSNALLGSSPKKAYDQAIRAYELSDSLGLKEMQASASNQIALSYYFRGNLDTSLVYLRISLKISEELKDTVRIANSINNIGVISYDQGQLDVALESYLRALDLKRRLNDSKASIAMTLNNIGNVYKDLEKFNESLQYYQQSLDLKKLDADLYGEAMTLNNIGLLHHDFKRYAEALDYYEQSLLIKKGIDDKHGEAMTINNIGGTYEEMGRYNDAIEYYEKANMLRIDIEDEFGRVLGMISLAGVYEKKAEWDRAIFYAENALRISKEINVRPHIRDSYEMLSRLHENKGDLVNSLVYYKQFTSWKDSVQDQKAQEDLSVIQSQEQVKKKNQDLQELQAATNNISDSYNNQSIVFWLILSLSLIVLGLLAMFYFRYHATRKISEHLKELSIVASETDNYVIITDAKDYILWVNKGFTKTTGYTFEEVQGLRPASFLRGHGTAADHAKALDDAYESINSVSGEVLNYRKDGKPIWLSFNASPVLDDKGEIEKFVTIGTDISASKEAQERLSKYSASLEVLHSIDAILLSDRSESEVLADTIRLIVDQIPHCDRIAFVSLMEDMENAEYFVSDSRTGGQIESEYISVKDFRTLELLKDREFYLEQNIETVENPSNSDKRLLEAGLKTYLAYPLRFQDEMIACLYLGSETPEVFTMSDLELLNEISNTLAIALTQKKFQEEIKQKNRNITDSINYAWRIQKAMLPNPEELSNYFQDNFLFYRPRDIVSGDFYWFGIKNEILIVACGDCTGHGVPGGFMTMMGMNLLNNIVNEKGVTDPSLILTYLHVGIKSSFSLSDSLMTDGMDISIIAIQPDKKTVDYAGARRPLYRIRNGEMQAWTGTKLSIGEPDYNDAPDFDGHTIDLESGDALYMFSDGYADQFGGPYEKKFGRRKLEKMLAENSQIPFLDQEEIIAAAFDEWKGTLEQVDDVVLIGMRI